MPFTQNLPTTISNVAKADKRKFCIHQLYRTFGIVLFTMAINMQANVLAQNNKQDIATDRPDQSNTPVLVPKAAVQVETGIMKETESQSAGTTTNYIFNTMLVKIGLNEHFELRVNGSYSGTRGYSQHETQSGFGPIVVGFKIKLADEHPFCPQVALIAQANFKISSQTFDDTNTAGDLTLSFAHDLSEKISLCYNTSVTLNRVGFDATFVMTGSLGYSVTPKLGLFVEAYSYLPEKNSPAKYIDGGVTYKATQVFQLDCSAGMSLSRGLSNSFVSGGLAIRLFK
jgi:hypothetical protein